MTLLKCKLWSSRRVTVVDVDSLQLNTVGHAVVREMSAPKGSLAETEHIYWWPRVTNLISVEHKDRHRMGQLRRAARALEEFAKTQVPL